MKNFKQITLGLILGAMVIGFSAFTNAPKRATGDVYANELGNGSYTLLANPYTPGDCASASIPCAFEVTAAGASHVTGGTLSSSQITTDLNNQWIEQEGSTNGVYSGD